jgi:hypothetical protein
LNLKNSLFFKKKKEIFIEIKNRDSKDHWKKVDDDLLEISSNRIRGLSKACA